MGAKNIKITFVELGCLVIEMDGKIIGEIRVKQPKMTQLILASAIRHELIKQGIKTTVEILDLKLDSKPHKKFYRKINYCGNVLDVGVLESEDEYIKNRTKDTDFICISANLTQEANIFKKTVKKIKKISRARIMVGGSDASLRPEWYISNGADYVVIGEGEDRLAKLISSISFRRDISDIDGIAYKKNKEIVLQKISPHKFVDLNHLCPIDFALVDLKKYNESYEGPLPEGVNPPLMFFESSRGCNHNCPNCTIPTVKGKYRRMSIQTIKKWLDHYKNSGMTTLLLMEDNLLTRLTLHNGKTELFEFFNYLRANGFAWEFPNGIEIGYLVRNNVIDKELMRLIFNHEKMAGKFIGCYRAYIPLETFDPALKLNYPKLPDTETTFDLLKSIIKTKIPFLTFGVMIFGLENNATIEKMYEFNDKIRTYSGSFGIKISWDIFSSMPIIGTPFYDQLKRSKSLVFSVKKYPELYNFYFCVFNSKKTSYKNIFSLVNKLGRELNET
ncbi:MAG: cobalamin B12-binding domain-containing protein [Candidatus Aenigmarchaeota archaeon]|nr:cobalamin B12-binding domain-containing protein [Candidatus Aenigmarchaeota archaeon]